MLICDGVTPDYFSQLRVRSIRTAPCDRQTAAKSVLTKSVAGSETAEHQPTIVRLLLTHGVDPFHKESSGYDAADAAAWYGEWRMGAYTAESAEIQAILNAHVESPKFRPMAWLFAWPIHVFLKKDSEVEVSSREASEPVWL